MTKNCCGVVPRFSAWVRVTIVALVVVGVDQLSKQLVEQSIAAGDERKLLPGIELVHTRNHGVAFGDLDEDFKLTNGKEFHLANRWTADVVKDANGQPVNVSNEWLLGYVPGVHGEYFDVTHDPAQRAAKLIPAGALP